MTTLHVSNIAFSATVKDITDLFSAVGPVKSVRIVSNDITGRSRGLGFVEMNDEVSAALAMDRFNGYEWFGQELSVRPAREE